MFRIPKAKASDFRGRFREIISDPLNSVIKRHPNAGLTKGDNVVLHNGLQVPISGDLSYYDSFSDILIFNRGVHEPLEELVFQTLLRKLPNQKVSMLELGAYWGHYSMWLLLHRPDSEVVLIEPESKNLEAGKHNFKENNFKGTFIQSFVGKGHFEVDEYFKNENIERLTILHSDIQGYEVEMLEGAARTLSQHKVDYVFVSTHSEELHRAVEEQLQRFGYITEVTSSFDRHTTSFDGFIFARSPKMNSIFEGFEFLGREDVLTLSPLEKIEYINKLRQFA